MTIIVNNSKIRIFRGATVRDVLLRFAVRNGLSLNNIESLKVTDRWGHDIDHTAPLRDKQIIKVLNL